MKRKVLLLMTGVIASMLSFASNSFETERIKSVNYFDNSFSAKLTPPSVVPTTELQPGSCGVTVSSFGSLLYAYSVGGSSVSHYEYQFTNTTSGAVTTLVRFYPNVSLAHMNLNTPNQTYDVAVRVMKDGVWGSFGPVCQVSSPANVPSTQLKPTSCGVTLNSFGGLYYANPVTGANKYEYQFTNTTSGAVTTVERFYPNVSLAHAGLNVPNESYDVAVRVNTGGVWGNYGASCQVTAPDIPTTELKATSCGVTLSSFGGLYYANAVVGADKYEYQFTNTVSGAVTTVERFYANVSLSHAGLNTPNESYNVAVRVKTGGVWGNYGASCQVTAPDVPTTALKPVYCGITLSTFGELLYITPVSGANLYEYRFTNTTTGVVTTVQRYYPKVSLNHANLSDFDQTYDVDVRVNMSGVWGSFGSVCQVTSPALQTQLKPTSCGVTLNSFSGLLYAYSVGGSSVSHYEFQFTNLTSGAVSTVVRYYPNVSLTHANLLTPSQSYNVRVRVMRNGVWGTFGPTCQVNSPNSVPTTQLKPTSCGVTLNSFGGLYYANTVSGASQYEYQFTNTTSGTVTTVVRNYPKVSLDHAGLTIPNQTYDVAVRAYVGGVWGSYGATCQVTSPDVQTTQLKTAYCGTTMGTFGAIVKVYIVSGANKYEYRFTNTTSGAVTTVERYYANVSLSNAGLMDYDQTYNVDVRVNTGGVWGPYGAPCQVNSPTSSPMIVNEGGSLAMAEEANSTESLEKSTATSSEEEQIEKSPIEVGVYPNPFTNNVNIDFGGNSLEKEIKIYNSLGQVVRLMTTSDSYLSLELNDLDQGVYILHVLSNGEMKSIRLVKQ